jgi:hypothetical protein
MLDSMNTTTRPKNDTTLSKQKMWLSGSLATILAITVSLVGLWSVSYYPFELFAGFKAEVTAEGEAVIVTGHVMGSMFCVGQLDHREQNGELNLRMRYRLICPSQRSGSFSILIHTSEKVRRVTYGDERTPIL